MQLRRGEVIRINLNPTQGREQMGEARPCLVLSQTVFNASRDGLVIVAPITSTIKPEIKTLIPIPAGFRVSGSVIAEQVRTLDLSQRWWRSTEEYLPLSLVDQVVAILNLIIGG
ncbi:growth inhibitor PemK [filamentous cyanobacterium CCT1]|nr:growth inhibitor PemK [filamentous cyanobacterium CCT1]PSN75965.1 growth inhibitor PemK [filamentous cyanobacterium CCP4]